MQSRLLQFWHTSCALAANDRNLPLVKEVTLGPEPTLTGHYMPRCSFPEADINWSFNFSIRKRLSMRSCTTRTLHVNQALAIPGYAAQVSVRAGSVVAHLASLNRNAPYLTLRGRYNFVYSLTIPAIH
jgi:hypothetical protein